MDKRKRVAFYLRVSTGSQTVENQRLDLARVAEQRGWTLVHEYVDSGVSGAKGRDKRPEFDSLCKDAAQGKFDLVAAWALDRIGRSTKHLLTFSEQLQAEHVDLFLYKQAVDTSTASGRLFFTLLSAVAEFERDLLRERIHSGLARARSQGKRLGRTPASAATEARIRQLRGKGLGKLKIARTLRIGTSVVQRVLAGA